MKICFLTQNLYTLGGVQIVVSSLVNGLVKGDKHSVDIYMPFGSVNDTVNRIKVSSKVKFYDMNQCFGKIGGDGKLINKFIIALNRRVGFLNNELCVDIFQWCYLPRKQKEKILSVLNSKMYDVIVGVADDYMLLLSMLSNNLKAKTYGWAHSTFEGYFKKRGCASYGTEYLLAHNASNMDGIFVLSEKDKKLYKALCDTKIEVLHNPLVITEREEDAAFTEKVIFVGRLNKKVKGLDFLVDIIKLVNDKDSKIRFVIIGEGKDKQYVIRAIKKKKLEKIVDIIGYTDNVEMYYKEASILISTSRWEGFGMTIIEAMANGLPVIAFENTGPNEIIKSQTGILIPQYDINQFAEKICYLLENEHIWKRYSISAKKESQKYSYNLILKQFESLLLE